MTYENKPKMPAGEHDARLTRGAFVIKPNKAPRLMLVFEDSFGQEAIFSSGFGHTNSGQFSDRGLGFAHGQMKALGLEGQPISDLLAVLKQGPKVRVTVEVRRNGALVHRLSRLVGRRNESPAGATP